MDFRAALERDRSMAGVPPMPQRNAFREYGRVPEARVAAAYERCHPGDSVADLKKRAQFSKEDRGLLADWMAAFAKEEGRS